MIYIFRPGSLIRDDINGLSKQFVGGGANI